jgi:hypothetical protein
MMKRGTELARGEREDIMVLKRGRLLYGTLETNGKGIKYIRGT